MPITSTKKKKDGLILYRVRVNYTDINGEYKQIERSVYGKAEAQEMEKQLMQEIQQPESKRMTVQSLFEEYIDEQRTQIRETSLDKTVRNLQLSVLSDLGKLSLDKITAQTVRKWKSNIDKKDIKVTTKRNYYKYFRALLNFAVKRGYIAANPLNLVGNFKDAYKETVEEILHYYTAEEYLRFADAARKSAEDKDTIKEWGFFVFFSIAFYTGMRKGEINALRWEDIDGNLIRVHRSIAQKLKGKDRITPPKNQPSNRTLQIPQPLAEILADHQNRLKLIPGYKESWFVCGGAECLRDTTIEKHNASFAEAAGLPHIRIHDFRHSHASLLCNEGINIQEIARRLGHADVQMTWNTYSHMYPREEERAMSILDKIK